MFTEEEIKRVFNQALKIWIIPDIEEKKKKGWLKEDFKFNKAQIIFTPNKTPKIKYNESVKVIASVKLKKNKSVKKGDPVYDSELESIEDIKVTYPSNSGHITLIQLLDRWIIVFDSRYNKKRISDFIEASKEFYESAKENLKKNRLRPFFENCWASAEISSSCHFLSLGQEYSNHRENLEKFKEWGKLGNVNKSHVDILSRLHKLRKSARYLNSSQFKHENNKEFLKCIKDMLKEAEKLGKT